MIRMEGELYYTRKMNILLLLHSQSEGEFNKKIFAHTDISLSIYRRKKNSSTYSEWKRSFNLKNKHDLPVKSQIRISLTDVEEFLVLL